MNGARSLVETLLASGVDTCFANPGTSEMHFVAALDKIEGMRCVLGLFEGWAPQAVVDAIASLSFLTHFGSISKGVIDVRDLLYFGVLIAVWLSANAIVLDMKKAD